MLELREIALLLRGQKSKVIEERNHVLDDCREVVDLEIPDSISPLPHRPASEIPLELREDHLIPLRDVETQRHFPWIPVVVSRTEGHVEATFSIRETGQVVSDRNRNRAWIEHRPSLSC